MPAPTAPRLAASVILMRRGGRHAERGVEVLLLRRSEAARFMPGVWVFPGGTVEPGEEPAAAAARELAEEAAIELPADARLVPWSRWITPEAVAIRFDTHFFVALAPPHAPPAPDGSEVTDARWIDPAEALERHGAGELELVFPTIKHLQSLLPYTSAEEVLDAAASRDLAPILPRVEGGRVVLPEGWPDI